MDLALKVLGARVWFRLQGIKRHLDMGRCQIEAVLIEKCQRILKRCACCSHDFFWHLAMTVDWFFHGKPRPLSLQARCSDIS